MWVLILQYGRPSCCVVFVVNGGRADRETMTEVGSPARQARWRGQMTSCCSIFGANCAERTTGAERLSIARKSSVLTVAIRGTIHYFRL